MYNNIEIYIKQYAIIKNKIARRNNMNNSTILVVDDESRMRKLIKDFLFQKGYNILEAEDGEQALKVFY